MTPHIQGVHAERHKNAPAEEPDRGKNFLHQLSQTAAHGAVRHAVAVVEAEAGAIITLAPSCPRRASRRVDVLTVAHDRLRGVEVAL
jgi:hypothetical protein